MRRSICRLAGLNYGARMIDALPSGYSPPKIRDSSSTTTATDDCLRRWEVLARSIGNRHQLFEHMVQPGLVTPALQFCGEDSRGRG